MIFMSSQQWKLAKGLKICCNSVCHILKSSLAVLSLIIHRVTDAADVCVDALLESSVKYSPHFDWVVAHIG